MDSEAIVVMIDVQNAFLLQLPLKRKANVQPSADFGTNKKKATGILVENKKNFRLLYHRCLTKAAKEVWV